MITMDQMNQQVARIAELRIKEEQASRVKKEIQEELAMEEGRMLEMLQESNVEKFSSPSGNVSIGFFSSVQVPKTKEDKEALLAHLRQEGLDHMISVNSQTLNAYVRSRIEQGILTTPGVGEPKVTPRLSFRK